MNDQAAETSSRWRLRLAQAVANSSGPSLSEVGRVREMNDGVVVVEGLTRAASEEMLTIDQPGGPVSALALSLSLNEVRCLVLGDEAGIAAGAAVRRTGQVLKVPVGDSLLGRVIGPMGTPLDGGGPIVPGDHWPAEREPLTIADRAHVCRPLETGLLAIDALLPLGLGQRQLIIGDRRTGKTTLALEAMVAQSLRGVIVIYAAIGQRASATANAIEHLRQFADFSNVLAVVAGPDDSAGSQWLLPFAATTMAEYWVSHGRDVLIVYDDLVKHAAVHRQVSLLLRQAPGREAFPGDIFHLHARLLERAGQVSASKGGASLSALPIAELQAGNLTAYIPTNLVSITDGQILMDAKLWQSGQRPAINIGLSVSRIGGNAQSPALRKGAGQIRLDYAQFLDLESFARFGGAMEADALLRLEHGKRIRAAMVQKPGKRLSQAGTLAILRAITSKAIDRLPIDQVGAFREQLNLAVGDRTPAIPAAIAAGDTLSDEMAISLDQLISNLLP